MRSIRNLSKKTKAGNAARDVAKKTHVAVRTVQKAVAVVRAIDTLPAEVKTDFLAGNISQKAVIEKAKEAAEPKPVAPPKNDGTDDLTRVAKKFGTAFLKIFEQYEDLVRTANTEFHCFGHKFVDHAQELFWFDQQHREISMRDLKIDAGLLKLLRLCPMCNGAKCGRCSQVGYVDSTDRKSLLMEMGGN